MPYEVYSKDEVDALLAALPEGDAVSGDPWICYGQTTCNANASTDNPTPNNNGLIGEITSLPYTVPTGKLLVIETYGVEGYDQTGGIAFFPVIGTSITSSSQCLPTAFAKANTAQLVNLDLRIPAGKIVNIRIQNGQASGGNPVVGWFVKGRLETV